MPEQRKQITTLVISVSAIILIAVAFPTIIGCQSDEPTPAAAPSNQEQDNQQEKQTKSNEPQATTNLPPKTSNEPQATSNEPQMMSIKPQPAKLSLSEVVRNARTWGPVYQSWYGKPAANFTLTDINGKQHNLSDYRGRNVLVVFWATWCGPCIKEMPYLIALRNIFSEDKLAILAISYTDPNNTAEIIKYFVEQNERINYTVFAADIAALPAPFDSIQSIPSCFFIDQSGKIKLATSGMLSLGEFKAILLAE